MVASKTSVSKRKVSKVKSVKKTASKSAGLASDASVADLVGKGASADSAGSPRADSAGSPRAGSAGSPRAGSARGVVVGPPQVESKPAGLVQSSEQPAQVRPVVVPPVGRPVAARSSTKGYGGAQPAYAQGSGEARPVVRGANQGAGAPVAGMQPVGSVSAPQVTSEVAQAGPGQVDYVEGRKVWRSPVLNGDGGGGFAGEVDGRMIPDAGVPTEEVRGILDPMRDGNGVLRAKYSVSDGDAYVSGTQVRRFKLRHGDEVTGPARKPKDNEQYWGLLKVEKVNGSSPDKVEDRVKFRNLTPVYPDEKLVLETKKDVLSTRLIDLVAPVGRGQRGMIVSPPKAGKTTILKDIASGVAENYKDIHLMAVLVGERPEEVTDIRRHIEKETGGKGEVAASNFDEPAEEQVRVAELALERAKRLVEIGKHVVIVLDSITRLARAYNLAIPTSGRTLSGGFDPAALYPPKRFFGAARNFEPFKTPQGKKTASLTILGTALVETGSKMDDLIYEEFKGTGNMELHLDRPLAERRIYPAIDVQRSSTRREDLLFTSSEYQSVVMMRRMIDMLDPKERTAVLVGRMKGTKSNKEFLATLKEG